MGFEPMISTVTGWRALQAAPRGQCFRLSSPGWTRTTDLLFVRELPLPLGHRTVCCIELRELESNQRLDVQSVASSH